MGTTRIYSLWLYHLGDIFTLGETKMNLKLTKLGTQRILEHFKDRGEDVARFYVLESQDAQYTIVLEPEWKKAHGPGYSSELYFDNPLCIQTISTPIGLSNHIFQDAKKDIPVFLVTKVISQDTEKEE